MEISIKKKKLVLSLLCFKLFVWEPASSISFAVTIHKEKYIIAEEGKKKQRQQVNQERKQRSQCLEVVVVHSRPLDNKRFVPINHIIHLFVCISFLTQILFLFSYHF